MPDASEPKQPASPPAPEDEPERTFSDLLRELWDFIASWFKTNTWAGWAAFLVAMIPDWQGRLSYWTDFLHKVGGGAEMLVGVLAYVQPALALGGLAYIFAIVLLEEYRRARPWMPLAAWTVLAVLFVIYSSLALFVIFIKSSRIPEAMAYFAEKAEVRGLSEQQRDRLKANLEKIKGDLPEFPLLAARDSETLQYASEMLPVLKAAGLKVKSGGKEQDRPEPQDLFHTAARGIMIGVQFADAPTRPAVLLRQAFSNAGFGAYYITVTQASADTLIVVVGPK